MPKMNLDMDRELDIDQLEKAIAKAVETAKTVRARVHEASVLLTIASVQAIDANDDVAKARIIQMATDMVTDLGNGINSVALVAWFQANTFQFKHGVEGFTGIKKADTIREKFNDAKAKPWYEHKKVNPYKAMDMAAMLHAITAKAKKDTQFKATVEADKEATAEQIKLASEIEVNEGMVKLVEKLANALDGNADLETADAVKLMEVA